MRRRQGDTGNTFGVGTEGRRTEATADDWERAETDDAKVEEAETEDCSADETEAEAEGEFEVALASAALVVEERLSPVRQLLSPEGLQDEEEASRQ